MIQIKRKNQRLDFHNRLRPIKKLVSIVPFFVRGYKEIYQVNETPFVGNTALYWCSVSLGKEKSI